MALQDDLDRAEAEVARIRREIVQGPCRTNGHDWQPLGGANAGCGEGCGCSVPVCVCRKCGDCDYGDTPEGDRIRQECADIRKAGA